MKKTLYIAIFCYSFLNAEAFFANSKEGWHFFKDDVNITKENNKTKIKQRVDEDKKFMESIPLSNLDLLSAEEFTQTFEKARKIATMKPTRSNVQVVQIMNKWQVDQSEKFAKVWSINLLDNPNLEYPEIRDDKFGRSEMYYRKQESIENFFKEHEQDLSFVVFVSGELNDAVNRKQKSVYNSLINDYFVNVEYVEIDKKPEVVESFGLGTTPENFFVYKNSKGEAIWHRIKAGLTNRDDLVYNTMFLFDNVILQKDR